MTKIQLHGYTLDLPDDHWLPQILNQLPDYGENVGRLAAVVEGKYPDRGFIDVGANVGDTAAIVRGHSKVPILCIEGSEFYYHLLKENTRQLRADVELECALLDAATIERSGNLNVEYGTAAFHEDANGGVLRRFTRLDSILERHPRFQASKTLKIDTDGMDGRILEGALDWVAAARPVLFWEHDLGRDENAGGPGLGIFERLREIGYRTALVFDNTGEFIQTVSLDARQQIAELSDYLPGGEQFYGYCDICAFHEEDRDLCIRVRDNEIENRRTRRNRHARPLNEPLFRALVESQFKNYGAQLAGTVQDTIRRVLNPKGDKSLVGELQALRAQSQFDRYRQQLRITDLETSVASRDAELHKLHAILRDLLAELLAERSTKHQIEAAKRQQELNEIHGQLTFARGETETLRHELQSSITLRAARSLHWILGPIRKLIGGSTNGGRP